MPVPVKSTAKMLMGKSTHSDKAEDWVDWAIEMIEAGYDTENLYLLAGMSKPYNPFQFDDLTNKTLSELGLDYKNITAIIKNYTYYIISKSLNNEVSFIETLKELKDICIRNDYDKEYYDFYLLFFAKNRFNLRK
jgi:hypothetical protein